MTDKEFLVQTIKYETPRFESVFKALPEGMEDLRHHPKNKNAMEIMTTMVAEASVLPEMLKTGIIDFSKSEAPKPTVAEITESLKNHLAEISKIVEGMSDEDWSSTAKMMQGEKTVWEIPKGGMMWTMMFDLIHHRGQLSTYIRPHGGKVPSIYGPSGDSASSGH